MEIISIIAESLSGSAALESNYPTAGHSKKNSSKNITVEGGTGFSVSQVHWAALGLLKEEQQQSCL